MKYFQLILGILVGLTIGYFVTLKINKIPIITKEINLLNYEKHEGGGNFTNPLLECVGVQDDESLGQLDISTPELTDLTASMEKKHKLEIMSVYLRDLNNGPWIGVNQGEEFIGGSLLKVPMLISYYKLAENDSSILKKVIEYKEKAVDNTQYYSPSKQIEVGKKYTVEELLKYMTYYSDNNAAYLLSQNIDPKEFDNVFIALGLGEPDINKPYKVNTKTYAGFFRILFNASYLSKSSSEKVLELLSQSEFNRGLQGLIPKSLVVSHKFGIRSDGDVNQLHDCGIVYYPGHPYLLCIMSRGGTFDSMAASISEVSEYIYNKISKTYPVFNSKN